jgi:TolB-like protein
MFTDMVGYTALGQKNESLSLALVEEQRKLIRPILARHNGREINAMGDAFLVEFPNAVDAVRCAYDIQRAIREFNLSIASDKRIHLRIGVHVGEVVEAKGDISGDAVNIASRIEPLAEDGGVCLTRQVYDHVRNKVDFPLLSLGPRSMKNVAEPTEIFRMVMPWEQQERPQAEPDKKRVAVLPFANMSPDPGDVYFSDGMTEEQIMSLSKIRELSVIARTSVMKYKGSMKGASEIGKELSAGTLMEGSVRKAGNRLRISVQLIDTKTEDHIWAQNYDRELDDVFAVQSEIAETVAKELRVQLVESEKRRLETVPTSSTAAYTLYLKGQYYLNERTREGMQKALQYFEAATRKDPNYARAYVGLAQGYILLENWAYLPPAEASSKYRAYITRALELDDSLAEAHAMYTVILTNNDFDLDGDEREFQRAIELNPNYATAHHWYANGLLGPLGKYDRAILEMTEAKKLDPLSPMVSVNLGDQLLFAGRIKEAMEEYRGVIDASPNFAYAHSRLGLALLRESRYDDAMREIQKAIDLDGGLGRANPELLADLIYANKVAGRKMDAESILAGLEVRSAHGYVSNVNLAMANAAAGSDDRAIELLRKAAEEKSVQLLESSDEPCFDHLRADARFRSLLRTMGVIVE